MYLGSPRGHQFSSVQLLSHVQLFVTPWTAACQAFLSITNSQSLLKFMSIESVMPSNHLILCHPLLPSIFPSIRVFSNESVHSIRWPKYCSFSFSISPSSEYSGLISFRVPSKTVFVTVLHQESRDFGGIMLSSDSVFVHFPMGFDLWGEDRSFPPRDCC